MVSGTLEDYPSDLHKKVSILKHFKTHFEKRESERGLEDASASSPVVYIKRWVRTRHAVAFRLSD